MNKPSILHSIKWNYFGAVIKGVSQLGVLGIMARLLTPEEFGLMALALVAIKFGSYFSDFGLAAAIQQKKEINDSDIQASFWFSTIAGLLFFLITFAIAEPLADFFDSPKLAPVITLVAISFILIGASATSMGLLRRNMQFKYLSIAETIIYLISNGIIGISLAYYDYGVTSLVIAYLSQQFLFFLATYAKTRHSIRINLTLADYKHVLTFGGGYSIASFMTFIGSNIDHILIGKFFPATELGLWNRSRNIISMPSYSLLVSITGVLLPSYSKLQHDNKQFSELYIKSLIIAGFFLIPIGGGMFSAAPQLVEVLLGKNWPDAVPLVQLSAIFVPVEMLASVAATACSALGALSLQIKLQSFLLILLAPIMLYFALQHQLIYILITLTAYYWLRFIMYILILGKKLQLKFMIQGEIIVSQLMAATWVGALIYLTAHYLPQINAFQLLPIEIAVGGFGLLLFIVMGPAKRLRQIIRVFLYQKKTNNTAIKLGKMILKNGY
ncbi:lipopolysaccharide biosynthesis protein [Methylobacter sp. S3L5C]|uniref:lipopolysaccharide biosynthesis protein n=1 Tax=Methylobacter sp. S3L5C TaxID=2839024 RepID=UPI001FAE1885|nr:lipopolysaccharide biosynthesis protein [Methylobacter sp. S3L5C]UOA08548.1 lipopolysaccharide biosynthesis protein [Methylobacter sp. S3L5C]